VKVVKVVEAPPIQLGADLEEIRSEPRKANAMVKSRDIRMGHVIVGRVGVPTWDRPAVVLSARWYPDLLSLDLCWPDDGNKVTTHCSLGADETFIVRAP
jgi:hypothetical protein